MPTVNRQKVNSIASLKALTGIVVGNVIETDSYYGDNNIGGNIFNCTYLDYTTHPDYISAITDVDNGGTAIVATDGRVYEALNKNTADIRQFGAKANDDTFDNVPIIQNMIDRDINIDCINSNDDFYVSSTTGNYFVEITESHSGLYINFGENFIVIKHLDVYSNSRAVIRYTGGATSPSYNIGTVKFRGEFDYDDYIVQLDADLESETIAAGNTGKTGVGRFEGGTGLGNIGAASTALTNFQIAFNATLEAQPTGNVVEGIQFLGGFGIINVDYIYGEYMSAQTARGNGSDGMILNINKLETRYSYGSPITCNVDSGLASTSPAMYLNINNVISYHCQGGFHLTSTIKTEIGKKAYSIADIKTIHIEGVSYISKCHGSWDYKFESFTNIKPHEYTAIGWSAWWNAYNFSKSQYIQNMHVDGYIGTYPVNNAGATASPIVIGNLNILNTYYLAASNVHINNGSSYYCKDLFVKDANGSSINNFRFENPSGIDYTDMFGGKYNSAVNMQYIQNIKITNSKFYNMFSYLNKLTYFIYYKGGVIYPDLDYDYLTLENLEFHEDVDSTANKITTAIIRNIKDVGLIKINNVKFFRADIEKTDSMMFYIADITHRSFIQVLDTNTNLFTGTSGYIVVGRGTLRYDGKVYTWRNNSDGFYYENTTYPTDEDDGTVINNGMSIVSTGTVLDLSNTGGTPYNMTTPSASTTFTTTNPVVMGSAVCKINAATEPVVTGATKITGSTFVANTDMYMAVRTFDGTNIEFYFTSIT